MTEKNNDRNNLIDIPPSALNWAPLLTKRLWFLFWLSIPAALFSLFTIFPPTLWGYIGEIGARLCSLCSSWVLLKMKPADKGYGTAAVCGFCGEALLLSTALLVHSTQEWRVALLVAGALFYVVASYHQFCAHSRAVGAVDEKLGHSWSKLWNWYIGGLCLAVVGICFAKSSFLLGFFIVLTAVLALAVTAIATLITLFRSAQVYQTMADASQE